MQREIIVVDDCSVDGSIDEIRKFAESQPDVDLLLIRHEKNRGKAAAIRTAIHEATGHFSIIQDADLEYDPNEYPRLLRPLLGGDADVVYGSRFMVAGERRVLYFWHSLANHILTLVCNIVADLNLTDMETCYKAFRTSFAQTIPIESERFGIEPELTVKFARRRARIYETPISYHGRTYEEGKKVGAKDAIEALWVILKARFAGRIYTDRGHAALDTFLAAPKFNRWMADTIAPWMGTRVLEIGAGTGNLARQLCQRKKLYIATDVNPEYVEHLRNVFRRRPQVVVRELDATRPDAFHDIERSADTVVCLNVLEHIDDDAGALARIRAVLEPGGRLILLVPNDPRIFGTLDEAVGHHRRYTRKSLATLLADAGYEVERMIEFNRVSWPGWKIAGQWLKADAVPGSGMHLFDRCVWLWRKIDANLPWEPLSIIAVARREDGATLQ